MSVSVCKHECEMCLCPSVCVVCTCKTTFTSVESLEALFVLMLCWGGGIVVSLCVTIASKCVCVRRFQWSERSNEPFNLFNNKNARR